MKLELTIPENWNDVSLKQFRQMLLLIEKYNVEDDEITKLKLRVAQIAIFNPQVKEEDLMKLKLSQLGEYFQKMEFLDAEPVKEIVKEWKLGDKTYHLNEFKNLSLDGWISAEKWSNIEDAHKLISIFYIDPREYSEIEVDRICDIIDNEPVSKSFYLVAQFFFIQKALEISGEIYIHKLNQLKKGIEKAEKIKMKWQQRLYKLGLRSWKKSPDMTLLK
jgi:hypothetical protein